MRKIGLFSGTFDPVHDGHVAFAKACLDTLKLDEVIFLPERAPRGKQNVSDLATRLAWLDTALAAHTQLSVLTLPEATFSIDVTLPQLMKKFPDAYFTFLLGVDVAMSLPQWPHLEQLPAHTTIAVGMRSTHGRKDVEAALQNLPPHLSYKIIATDFGHVSSSHLRKNS